MAALAAALVLPVPAGAAASHHGRPTSRPVPSAGPSSALVLESQTPWVGPDQTSFALGLQPGVASLPRSQLGLTVAVYPCLSSVSGFDQSLTSVPSSADALSATPSPIPLTGLPVSPNGVVDLSMGVVVGTGRAPGSPPFTIDLAPSASQCGAYPEGVYPVRVDLVDTASSQVLGGLTTHLVYADPATGTERLRVAVVLPLHAAVGPAAAPTARQLLEDPSAALDPPGAASVAGLTGTVAAIARYPTVPLTLEASPQTVASLDASAATRPTVAQLAELAVTPSVDQFAAAPYAPVNANGLVAAGLSGELGLQVSRGLAVLSTLVTHTATAGAVGGATGDLGPWITNDGLDTATLAQLETEGYSQVVLPAASVDAPPSQGSTTEPFTVASGHGSTMTAVASSPDLASRFVDTPGDPVLAAHQLVAELAQIYYEEPNDIDPRATAVVAPSGWTADPAFVDALLDSLTSNPIIEGVTTSQLFTTLPVVTACRTGCRLTGAAAGGGLPVAAIRQQRARVDGFASAAASARSVADQLGDLVLAGESESLRPAQQADVLDNTGRAVDAQLGQLSVGGDRTVTLTSQQGTLQVTVVSTAPYPVTASLTLTSDKLLFPNGTTQWSQTTTLLPAVSGAAHTNVVPVPVRARAPGVFTVDIVMHSPAGRLELASGQVSVRSTATSVVGIVLSVGALAVLAVWWVRTSLRRRRQRRLDADEPLGGAAAS